jgi:hypothetical protein
MKLPITIFSIDQIEMWSTDKFKFIKKYFMDLDNVSHSIGFKIEKKFSNYTLEAYVTDLNLETINFKIDKNSIKDIQKKLQLYSLLVWEITGNIPICNIGYYNQTKENIVENVSIKYEPDLLINTKTYLDNVISEIHKISEFYYSDTLNDLMENYIEILIKEKDNKKQKKILRTEIKNILGDTNYIKKFKNKIVVYLLSEKKRHIFSKKIQKLEEDLKLMKKQEIKYGETLESKKNTHRIAISNVDLVSSKLDKKKN